MLHCYLGSPFGGAVTAGDGEGDGGNDLVRFCHFVQAISGRNGAKWGGILQKFNPNLRSFDKFLYQTY
jgi:hypothetical protein